MNGIAKEKKNYHHVLINSTLNRYTDPIEHKTLIEQRMLDPIITTHMSLKQALKKSKDMTRTLSQVRQERAQVNINIAESNFDPPGQAQGEKSDEEVEESEDSDNNKIVVKNFTDVPVIDFMKHGMQAVIESYSVKMNEAISNVILQAEGDEIEESKEKKKASIDQAYKKIHDIKRKKQNTAENNTVELDEQKENKILELLNDSETYLQKNLNAAANNMSMLTLHSFEFANYFEQQKRDQIT